MTDQPNVSAGPSQAEMLFRLNQTGGGGGGGGAAVGPSGGPESMSSPGILTCVLARLGIRVNAHSATDGDHGNLSKVASSVQINNVGFHNFDVQGGFVNLSDLFSRLVSDVPDHTSGITSAESGGSASGGGGGDFSSGGSGGGGSSGDYEPAAAASGGGGSSQAIVFHGNATEIEAPSIGGGGFLGAILGGGRGGGSGGGGGMEL